MTLAIVLPQPPQVPKLPGQTPKSQPVALGAGPGVEPGVEPAAGEEAMPLTLTFWRRSLLVQILQKAARPAARAAPGGG